MMTMDQLFEEVNNKMKEEEERFKKMNETWIESLKKSIQKD